MSAPVHHETMQQIADRVGVSRRSLFYAQAVHRYGCPELLKAAESERLLLKGDILHRQRQDKPAKDSHG